MLPLLSPTTTQGTIRPVNQETEQAGFARRIRITGVAAAAVVVGVVVVVLLFVEEECGCCCTFHKARYDFVLVLLTSTAAAVLLSASTANATTPNEDEDDELEEEEESCRGFDKSILASRRSVPVVEVGSTRVYTWPVEVPTRRDTFDVLSVVVPLLLVLSSVTVVTLHSKLDGRSKVVEPRRCKDIFCCCC
jgi:hypothetical protein